MTQETIAKTIEKEIPKTITVDVSATSWDEGYNAANKDCKSYSQAQDKYYMFTANQWKDNIQFLLGLIFVAGWLIWIIRRSCSRSIEKYDKAVKLSETSIADQIRLIAGQEKTNDLLQQLLEKIDKK